MRTKQAEAFTPRLLVIHEVDVFLTEVSSVKDETGFLSNQSSDDLHPDDTFSYSPFSLR